MTKAVAALVLLAGVLVIAGGAGSCFWWGRAKDAAFRADSLQAVNDSTRRVLTSELDSTVSAWQRRAVQQRQERDSIDRMLRLERRARVRAQVTVERLSAQDSAEVQERDSVRSARFVGRQEPYSYEATVTLPPPPAEGALSLQVMLDTLRLEARIGCADPVGGVRPAQVTVLGPSWAGLQLTDVEQDPAVCPSPILARPAFALWRGDVPWWSVPAAFLVGLLLGGR